ncbi:hypothetical protein L2E82_19062 [Cichorium intybus]|uniref:Uncharacterized protein n=1 Tax=Cichorium intybus TaxID=13427 RepID=A0ACB9FAU6_CICIN|nr:hypothetical protein L2E82_19062 [Cichorium intybus]
MLIISIWWELKGKKFWRERGVEGALKDRLGRIESVTNKYARSSMAVTFHLDRTYSIEDGGGLEKRVDGPVGVMTLSKASLATDGDVARLEPSTSKRKVTPLDQKVIGT